jgi:hypothetical protein
MKYESGIVLRSPKEAGRCSDLSSNNDFSGLRDRVHDRVPEGLRAPDYIIGDWARCSKRRTIRPVMDIAEGEFRE